MTVNDIIAIWFENWGIVSPGLKTGAMGPKSSTGGGRHVAQD